MPDLECHCSIVVHFNHVKKKTATFTLTVFYVARYYLMKDSQIKKRR